MATKFTLIAATTVLIVLAYFQIQAIGWLFSSTANNRLIAAPISGKAPLLVSFRSIDLGFVYAQSGVYLDFGDGRRSLLCGKCSTATCSVGANLCPYQITASHVYSAPSVYFARLLSYYSSTTPTELGEATIIVR